MLAAIAILGSFAVGLAACSSRGAAPVPSDGSAPPSTGGPTEAPNGPAGGELEWRDCDGPECARVPVPLDHDDPDGETIEIALLRGSRADPERRIGSLLVNPGGPGGSGTDLARYLRLPRSVTERFDIVGFDPRGVGDSTALDCHTHLQEMYDADPTPETDEERRALLEVSQRFTDECEERHGELLDHMGTVSVARDLDLVREALGEERLDYLGYSYGTVIGQQYARLFPERVRTMVLDGVVDPDIGGLDGAAFQAAGFEGALEAFITWCDSTGCAGSDTAAVVDRAIAAVEAGPVPSRRADRPATPGNLFLGIAQALYAEWMWPELGASLQELLDGNGTGIVDLADAYLRREGDDYPGGLEVYFAVSCVDSEWPDDPDDVFAFARKTAETSPRIGEALVNDYVRCAGWPADPQPIEPIPSDIEGLAPILIVSTTGDPATPHGAAIALAESIPGARLLTNRGEGHTIVGNGKTCIDDIVADYLIEERIPDDDPTC